MMVQRPRHEVCRGAGTAGQAGVGTPGLVATGRVSASICLPEASCPGRGPHGGQMERAGGIGCFSSGLRETLRPAQGCGFLLKTTEGI